MSSSKPSRFLEQIYNQEGDLLHEAPFRFSRLFAAGQEQVLEGVTMTIISCEKKGTTIKTVVRTHSPWPRPPLVRTTGAYLSYSREGMENGSVYRVTGRRKERFARYSLGDFIGFTNEVPPDYTFALPWREAKHVLPACFR